MEQIDWAAKRSIAKREPNRPITDRRRAVLESVGIGVLVITESGHPEPVGQLTIDIMGEVRMG